jgi:ABC-2 type transport system permease protein
MRTAQAVRTTRALWWGWKAEFSGAAEYRLDLVSGTLVSAVWLGLSIAPMLVIAANSATAPGWTLPRLLFLQAVWYLMDGVLWMIIANNAREISSMVRDGTLDAVLLRPISSLVTCTLGHLYVQDVPKVVLALGLGVVSCLMGGGPASVPALLGCLVTVVCACCLMWAVGVLANYKAISQVRFDGMFAVTAAHNLARVPIPLYGPVLQVVLTFVVPVAFLCTVPAQVLFGDVDLQWVLVAVLLTAAVLWVTSRLWNRELRSYAGAMG